MIPRQMMSKVIALAKSFPVVALIGPRQSGKSTLARHAFPKKPYVTLEPLDVRSAAQNDPRGFLSQYPEGAVLDEVQRAPEIFSYLQEMVDNHNHPGQFILTGSQNFLLMESVSQSLAGRVALLELLPFARHELPMKLRPARLEEALFLGGYPRLYDQHISPHDWYPSYLQTYVERDVRQLINVTNLETFRRFLGLCAARTGQLLNYSSLASDAGVSHPTVMAWINLLETSFIIHLLRPHHANFNKRLTKMPKLHFIDTGLACSLLGIEEAAQLTSHPLKGALFETWAVSELLKQRLNEGQRSNLFHWRDKTGHEIDVLSDRAGKLFPFEIKAGQTVSQDMFRDILYWRKLAGAKAAQATLIYGGAASLPNPAATVLSWKDVSLK
jgi:predicted AAA+ superfamily ATPase